MSPNRADYPPPFLNLARELRRLPGIGARSAERLALWLVTSKKSRPLELAAALHSAAESLKHCRRCGFFAIGDECELCQDGNRIGHGLCVVENPTDVLPIERSDSFHGHYHVLGGKLSPLDHVGPEDLRINSLIDRVRREKPAEVILALSADVEGEATTHYLAGLLQPTGIRISRIAHGLPVGGGLDHADPLTLQRALSARQST